MQVSLLCSGSAGNCCIVQGPHTSLMIDCGSPTQKYLKACFQEIEFDPDAVDAVLITHSHSDHIKQLKMMKNHEIYSYCDLRITNTKNEEIPLHHHLIVPDEIFEIGDFTVHTLELSHDAGKTLGFVLEQNETKEKLVYVTDTGYFPMSYHELIRGADYYIMESNHDPDMLMRTNRSMWVKQRILSDQGHLNNSDSAALIASVVTRRTRKIVLAHLSREANTEAKALSALEIALHEKGYCLQDFDAEAAAQFQITEFGRPLNPADDLQETAGEQTSPEEPDEKSEKEEPSGQPAAQQAESLSPGQPEDQEKKASFRVLSMPKKRKSMHPAVSREELQELRRQQTLKDQAALTSCLTDIFKN